MASSVSQGQILTFALNPTNQSTLSPALQQRACDRCRRRKTRCDGLDPCKTCSRVGVECLYVLPQKPKGRKPRGKPQKHDAATIEIETDTSNQASDGDRERPRSWHAVTQLRPAQSADVFIRSNAPQSTSPSPPILRSSSISQPFTYPNGGRPYLPTFPYSTFTPYIALFFDRLYPIFPVFDPSKLHETVAGTSTEGAESSPSFRSYAFLTSLSAFVTLQLNLHNQKCLEDAFQTLNHRSGQLSSSDRTNLTFISAENFITHCLQARQQFDFMSTPDEADIMTSFFLFGHYGNNSNSKKAWYYLREAIGFAMDLRMDEPEAYWSLPNVDAQRRCRMFWLLYITERAYALQHRSSVILRPSIPLPRVLDPADRQLIGGFVYLITVYRCVDLQFLSAWKAKPSQDLESIRYESPNPSIDNKVNEADGTVAIISEAEIMETQYMDIKVTQMWLPLLQWQLRNGRRLTSTNVSYPVSTSKQEPAFLPGFPFKVSWELLNIIHSAGNRRSLESHGIGMEQKIFDVACCLSDVLESARLSREAAATGHRYLHGFMTLLQSFRYQESQYLQPLIERAAKNLAAELQSPLALTAPDEEETDLIEEHWI